MKSVENLTLEGLMNTLINYKERRCFIPVRIESDEKNAFIQGRLKVLFDGVLECDKERLICMNRLGIRRYVL